MLDEQRCIISEARALNPASVAEAAATRKRRPWLGPTGRLMIIAADHSARGVLAAGDRQMAMANRADLLDRILVALSRPGVDGILGSADIIDDLLLLGALEGKMLLRIDPADPATAGTLQACANAVTDLASRRLIALIEPFMVRRIPDLANDLSPDSVVKSIAIASGLGAASAYSWLKIPVIDDMERVALSLPGVRGIVAGRNLLYPPDDDVAGAVDIAVSLL